MQISRSIMVKVAAAAAGLLVVALAVQVFALSGAPANKQEKGYVLANTPTVTAMASPTVVPTSSHTVVSTATPTSSPTATSIPADTITPLSGNTSTPAPTNTPTPVTPVAPSAVSTSPPTALPIATAQPLPTATAVSRGAGSPLGIWSGGGDSTMVDLLKEAGAGWTRISLSWADVEASPGNYNFGGYDGLLAALAKAGVNTIVGIQNNPGWVASTKCGPVDKSADGFASFLRALVTHYKDAPYSVKHWEFYNEPDNRIAVPWGDFLGGCFGDDPGGYVETLRIASTAIKQVDPEAKIVFGGVALGQSMDRSTGQQIFNQDFFKQTLALGAGAYFDVANIHYYSSQAPAFVSYGPDLIGKVVMVRQLMAAYGVNKPMVMTELSWTSTPVNSPDLPEMQARYVPKALARSLAANLYAVTYFLLKDWEGTDYPYGLIDVNSTPKPAYKAFQVAIAEFGQTTSVRALTATDLGGVTGVEGYAFKVDGQERWILWSENGDKQVSLSGRRAEARDKLGQPVPLGGGGASPVITVGDSPIYLRVQS